MANLSLILFFQKKMEFFYEKIYQVSNIKKCSVDILSAGNLVHDTIECQRDCDVKSFLLKLRELVGNIGKQETVSNSNRLKFIELKTNHLSVFVIIDLLIRKFNLHLYSIDTYTLKIAIYFGYEKMKSYIKVVNRTEKLQGQLTVLEKAFLWFFLFYKKIVQIKKMAQFQPRLNAILDEIKKVHDYLNYIVDSEEYMHINCLS